MNRYVVVIKCWSPRGRWNQPSAEVQPERSTAILVDAYTKEDAEAVATRYEDGGLLKGTMRTYEVLQVNPDPQVAYQDPPTEAQVALVGQPYRCDVPMCGDSGICEECRRRGAG